MILATFVSTDDLVKEGKNYNWKRPCKCQNPGCKSEKLWGHGYVKRYFFACSEAVYLKRWRCPHCHSVITTRPKSFWRRFQETKSRIFEALRHRLHPKIPKAWPLWTTRQRAGHWLKKLLNHAKAYNLMKEKDPLSTVAFYQEKYLDIFG